MKAQRLSVIALSFAALVAGNAFAADPSAAKTREQVRAELAEARATGNIIANSEVHLTERELFPGRYEQATAPVAAKAAPAAAAVTSGKTRAEVLAELAEARRTGDIIANSEVSITERDLFPGRYAAQDTLQAGQPASSTAQAADATVRQ